MSFFGSTLFCGVMVSSSFIVVCSRTNAPLVWAAIATLAGVSALSIGKAWLRLKAVEMVIPSARVQRLAQLTLWLISPLIFLYNCLCALFSRTIVWRGICYRLSSHEKTEVLERAEK
jgi:hypothetical protein